MSRKRSIIAIASLIAILVVGHSIEMHYLQQNGELWVILDEQNQPIYALKAFNSHIVNWNAIITLPFNFNKAEVKEGVEYKTYPAKKVGWWISNGWGLVWKLDNSRPKGELWSL